MKGLINHFTGIVKADEISPELYGWEFLNVTLVKNAGFLSITVFIKVVFFSVRISILYPRRRQKPTKSDDI